MAEESIEIRDDPEASRFEILVGGRPAGFAAYRRPPAAVAFTHTEIDDEHEGRGLGGKLIAEALARVRAEGLSVSHLARSADAGRDRGGGASQPVMLTKALDLSAKRKAPVNLPLDPLRGRIAGPRRVVQSYSVGT